MVLRGEGWRDTPRDWSTRRHHPLQAYTCYHVWMVIMHRMNTGHTSTKSSHQHAYVLQTAVKLMHWCSLCYGEAWHRDGRRLHSAEAPSWLPPYSPHPTHPHGSL